MRTDLMSREEAAARREQYLAEMAKLLDERKGA